LLHEVHHLEALIELPRHVRRGRRRRRIDVVRLTAEALGIALDVLGKRGRLREEVTPVLIGDLEAPGGGGRRRRSDGLRGGRSREFGGWRGRRSDGTLRNRRRVVGEPRCTWNAPRPRDTLGIGCNGARHSTCGAVTERATGGGELGRAR